MVSGTIQGSGTRNGAGILTISERKARTGNGSSAGNAGSTTGATVGVGEGTAARANSPKAVRTRTREATDNRDQGGVDINSAKGQGVFSSFVGSYLFNLDPINLFFIL